jgi:hypothetical protein
MVDRRRELPKTSIENYTREQIIDGIHAGGLGPGEVMSLLRMLERRAQDPALTEQPALQGAGVELQTVSAPAIEAPQPHKASAWD